MTSVSQERWSDLVQSIPLGRVLPAPKISTSTAAYLETSSSVRARLQSNWCQRGGLNRNERCEDKVPPRVPAQLVPG